MAPLPDNLTRRVFFDYVTSITAVVAQNHTAMLRFAFDTIDTNAVAAQTKFLDFLTALGAANLWQGWTVTGVRVSEGGTVISTPVPILPALDAFVGTAPTTGALVSSAAIEQVMVGRSPLTGVRGRFSLYGRAFINIGDFRDTASGQMTAGIAALNSNAGALPVAADNTRLTWYQYFNFNYNSYWERELRV